MYIYFVFFLLLLLSFLGIRMRMRMRMGKTPELVFCRVFISHAPHKMLITIWLHDVMPSSSSSSSRGSSKQLVTMQRVTLVVSPTDTINEISFSAIIN